MLGRIVGTVDFDGIETNHAGWTQMLETLLDADRVTVG